MIDSLSIDETTILVHTTERSLKVTKAFTHGGIIINNQARTIVFGKYPPIPLPEALQLNNGDTVNFQLLDPDGIPKKQTRSGSLVGTEKQPHILRIAGLAKTPSQFSSADGWRIEVSKMRAYFTHPGLATDREIPVWMKEFIERQKKFWNKLAYLCREARRNCTPDASEKIIEFTQEVVLPTIDSFNETMGRPRAKEKLKHPRKLKAEMPTIDNLWGFVGELRKRIKDGRAVPEGLLEVVVGFAEQFKVNYEPYNEFIHRLDEIAEREAATLALRHFEIRPIVNSFKAALDRRKKAKLPWSDGWPRIKYDDRPGDQDWGIHYYFNKAGIKADLLETPQGLPGLTFGPPIAPSESGHGRMRKGSLQERKRVLREAQISLLGDEKQRWNFRFAVLQHQPLPENSHVKQWSLICSSGNLWLCLTIERQRPIPIKDTVAAGLDIGWRRTEGGIRFGTLYEPLTGTFRELTIDFQRSPVHTKLRAPWRIDMGPTRWEKRNISRLIQDWKPGDPIPTTFRIRELLTEQRSSIKDRAKRILVQQLGDSLPPWFNKAGQRGLLKLKEDFKDNLDVAQIIEDFINKTAALNKLAAPYLDHQTKRLEYGQEQIANDVCLYLQEKGITNLMIEGAFIAKASRELDNNDHEALKNSQKYRQYAAVSRFVSILKNTTNKYGITVNICEPSNTTRIDSACNHLNPATEKEEYSCEKCGRRIKQDQNSAVNLSLFAAHQELAEKVGRAHITTAAAKQAGK